MTAYTVEATVVVMPPTSQAPRGASIPARKPMIIGGGWIAIWTMVATIAFARIDGIARDCGHGRHRQRYDQGLGVECDRGKCPDVPRDVRRAGCLAQGSEDAGARRRRGQSRRTRRSRGGRSRGGRGPRGGSVRGAGKTEPEQAAAGAGRGRGLLGRFALPFLHRLAGEVRRPVATAGFGALRALRAGHRTSNPWGMTLGRRRASYRAGRRAVPPGKSWCRNER